MTTIHSSRIGVALILAGLLVGMSSCKDSPKKTPQDAQGVERGTEAPSDIKQVPIPLSLPKPMFVGTPKNLGGIPNLEKLLTTPRLPFLAPEGTTNVALGKTVTGSGEAPLIGSLDMITDGDKAGAEGSFVELGLFEQHVTIDLGAPFEIYAVVVWHFHKEPTVYYDVITQISNDPTFADNVTTIFNNDTDNSLKLGEGSDKHYVETSEGKLMDARSTQGQYVRCYSNGNNANEVNHYIEVEVYGRPVDQMNQN